MVAAVTFWGQVSSPTLQKFLIIKEKISKYYCAIKKHNPQ